MGLSYTEIVPSYKEYKKEDEMIQNLVHKLIDGLERKRRKGCYLFIGLWITWVIGFLLSYFLVRRSYMLYISFYNLVSYQSIKR